MCRPPLRTTELQAASKSQFGQLASLDHTIKQECHHLLQVDETTSLVQPVHATVREFLLSHPSSEFAVHGIEAHQSLAIIRFGRWNDDVFDDFISKLCLQTQERNALDKSTSPSELLGDSLVGANAAG